MANNGPNSLLVDAGVTKLTEEEFPWDYIAGMTGKSECELKTSRSSRVVCSVSFWLLNLSLSPALEVVWLVGFFNLWF